MTFDECELKANELRQKDPTAGEPNKLIMYLPTVFDHEKYACLTRHTRMTSHKKAFEHCGYDGEDLSIFLFDPETEDWTPVSF